MTGFRNIEEDEMDKIVRVNSDEYDIDEDSERIVKGKYVIN